MTSLVQGADRAQAPETRRYRARSTIVVLPVERRSASTSAATGSLGGRWFRPGCRNSPGVPRTVVPIHRLSWCGEVITCQWASKMSHWYGLTCQIAGYSCCGVVGSSSSAVSGGSGVRAACSDGGSLWHTWVGYHLTSLRRGAASLLSRESSCPRGGGVTKCDRGFSSPAAHTPLSCYNLLLIVKMCSGIPDLLRHPGPAQAIARVP